MAGIFTSFVVATLINVSAAGWAPGGGEFKCYEDYRCITDTGSPQYELQMNAWTDDNGIRRVEDFYCVALGSAYGSEIGEKYIITLDTGREIPVILADQKADCDTVDDHTRDINGAVIEFVVDDEVIPYSVKQSGDISSIPGFDGAVKEIRRLQ